MQIRHIWKTSPPHLCLRPSQMNRISSRHINHIKTTKKTKLKIVQMLSEWYILYNFMDSCLGATAYVGLHPVCLPVRPWAHHGNKVWSSIWEKIPDIWDIWKDILWHTETSSWLLIDRRDCAYQRAQWNDVSLYLAIRFRCACRCWGISFVSVVDCCGRILSKIHRRSSHQKKWYSLDVTSPPGGLNTW